MSTSAKNDRDNLLEHPEFVPFQNNQSFDHKKFYWKKQGAPQGGNNKPLKPEKPDRLQKPSIHKMMLTLDRWLPRRTRKV